MSVEVGDVVTVRGEDQRNDSGPWSIREIYDDNTAILWSSMQPFRREPVEDLHLVKKEENTIPPVTIPDQD